MAELLTANQPFQDVDGKPIVNGFIYVGVENADSILNPIPIFSDRELTVTLDNPQRTDSLGRPVNKIWGTGRYSVLVQDVNTVQRFTDPDTGELESAGLVTLTNVQGLNDITAEGVPAIDGYIDKTLYVFTTAGINTGDVTLDIDNNGPVSVLKDHDKEIAPGNFEFGQIIVVSYNALTNKFEMVSQIADDGQFIISIWSDSIASIPQGWVICDGNNGTPNLQNQFLRGAGDTFSVDQTGGSETTGSTALTEAQIPAHTHSYLHGRVAGLDSGPDSGVFSQLTGNNTGSTGGGAGHTHPGNVPPFYALAFIMKL